MCALVSALSATSVSIKHLCNAIISSQKDFKIFTSFTKCLKCNFCGKQQNCTSCELLDLVSTQSPVTTQGEAPVCLMLYSQTQSRGLRSPWGVNAVTAHVSLMYRARNQTWGLTELHFLLFGSVTLQCFQRVFKKKLKQLSDVGIEQRPAGNETWEWVCLFRSEFTAS